MKSYLSKLSLILIGFIGSVAFLISCDVGDDSNKEINITQKDVSIETEATQPKKNISTDTEFTEYVSPMTDAVSYNVVITGDKGQIIFSCAPKGTRILAFTGLPYDRSLYVFPGLGMGFEFRFDKTEKLPFRPLYRDGVYRIYTDLDQGREQTDFLNKLSKHKKLLIGTKTGIYTYNLEGAAEVISKALSKCSIQINSN